jgi:hypothetical protein
MTSQIQNAFEAFPDQLLLKVLRADTSSLDLYGSALLETIDRGLLGEDEFESLFKRFVHLGLDSLWSRYLELDELGWEDSPEEALAEFLRHVKSWNAASQEPIEWPWPITEIPAGKGG